jgi:BRCT domain type II-containing protein
MASFPVKPDALVGKHVIITGEIDGYARSAAQKFLTDAGATFEKSLNKKVNLVVLGSEPGQKKLDKIQEMNIQTRQWEDVIAEIRADGEDVAAPDEDDAETTEDEATVELLSLLQTELIKLTLSPGGAGQSG